MSVHELDRSVQVSSARPPAALACPTWCVLDRGHVAEQAADGGGVLHRGAETIVTCRSTELAAPVHGSVEVRVRRQWWIEFDDSLGVWVAEPEPTVHVSDLPDFPLHPHDALALALALAPDAGWTRRHANPWATSHPTG